MVMKEYTEVERIQFLKTAESGWITDAMRLLKIKERVINGILPLKTYSTVAGRVFTMPTEHIVDPQQQTYTNFEMCNLIEQNPNQVGVICCIGDELGRAQNQFSLCGDNLVRAMMNKGLTGLVIAGKSRDYNPIRALDFPVFAEGPSIKLPSVPVQWTKLNTPVEYAGVIINPGDYIMGDADGVAIISPEDIDSIIYQAERIDILERVFSCALDNNADMVDFAKITAIKRISRE